MLHLELPKYKMIEQISKTSPEYISFSQGAVKVGGTPAEIKAHVASLLETDCCDYYQSVAGLYPLREKIAQRLTEKFGPLFTPEHILVTHGSIGGITALCLSLLKEGDEVLLPEPTYPSYRNIILFSKGQPIFTPAFFEDKEGWMLNLDALEHARTSRTKMLILPNPSNPCGFCLSTQDLLQLKAWGEAHGIYVVIDEVYDNYIFEAQFASSTPFVLESNYLIRTGSFSKDFAMSGWRIGFVVGSPLLITHLINIQDGTLGCPSVVGQQAALYALAHPHLIARQTAAVKTSRDLACSLLTPLVEQGIFSYTKPKAGIFLFLKTKELNTEELVMRLLNQCKVALVPGTDFGNSASSYIRLCYAREEPLIEEGMRRLCRFFGG
ncbi:pyridoxal phosphate-dependent aminotransferase [Candidatus Protochlamydia phocaeensis]|uniref:pyridoxal phosphate-dependent aminotransferase n=1 Tax=Candidatus Protochlamydia phocaeensis TaxID=1414722 RepID=UPI0008385306|nr:pyridoxal phosphate-dependent aminotransferase [Candidatus Protochlamydia phocaeensis]